MIPVQIDQTLRRLFGPVTTPLLEILARKLLEDQTIHHVIARCFVDDVRLTDIILGRLVREGDFQRLRLTVPENFHRQLIADVSLGRDEIDERDPPVKCFLVIPILIDRHPRHFQEHIAHFQPRLGCRTIRDDLRHVNAAAARGQFGVVPQLWVAQGGVVQTDVRKALVAAAVGVLEEVSDDRRGQHVHRLRARLVTHQNARKFAVLDDRRGEAALPILERQAQTVDQHGDAF